MITQLCNNGQNWKVTQMRAVTLHYVKVPMLICSYDLVICRKNIYQVRWVILLFRLACQVIQALCMPRRACSGWCDISLHRFSIRTEMLNP
jgi:hypothetical protein